jgi:RimJ/RimL family protein N-acetyltransferase
MLPIELLLPDGRAAVVREATAGDAAALLEYLEVVSGETEFLTMGPGDFKLGEAEERAFLEASAAADNRIYLVAVVDGELVAQIAFAGGHRPRTRHTGVLGITVRRSHWGQGIGSALLDALIDWARSSGVSKIDLRVRTDNHRAISLYRRKGFVIEGTITRTSRVHGNDHDDHAMGLEL